MADIKLGIDIPRQSVIYIGICLTGIAIFVFAGIVPAGRTLAKLDGQIADTQFRLEEQKTLTPLLQSLQVESDRKGSQLLPLPPKEKLPQTRIDTLPVTFGSAAKMIGMTMVSAFPNLGALTGDAQLLSVDLVLRGDFIRFRKYLLQIGGLPYVHHIEEITIQKKADVPEFRLKIWVALG